MNKKYLLGLQAEYNSNSQFKSTVGKIADGLINSDLQKDDIVRICDMAAIVALDAIERGFRNYGDE